MLTPDFASGLLVGIWVGFVLGLAFDRYLLIPIVDWYATWLRRRGR